MSVKLNHDGVSKVLYDQVMTSIEKINEANKVLLAEDTGTSVRDIDKALKAATKEDSEVELPQEVVGQWEKAEAAQKVYKENLEAARNYYRTEVLGEEPKTETDDTDKELVKEVRQVAMNGLTFLQTYAAQNGMDDVLAWIKTVQVPMVGRQGSSSAGAKKPRVFVKIGDTVYDSFSLAAVALSSKDNKVTAGDFAQAWSDAGGEEGEFDFKVGEDVHTVGVTYKTKKSD